MNPPKQFSKNNEEDSSRPAGSPRAESPKKAPPKPKKTESVKKAAKKSDDGATPWWERARQYLREVAYEMRKVVWPSRKETLGSTAVVLLIVILAGIFLGVVDLILSRLVRLFVG